MYLFSFVILKVASTASTFNYIECCQSLKAWTLSFPKLQSDWKSVEYEGSYEKNVCFRFNAIYVDAVNADQFTVWIIIQSI